ncbi:MAG: hypothetical protein O8C61_12115 [Candidatus Methanoperedens sp.]|nr:hypothetical protein [Candidatus Methanoperedens sp.]
MGLIENRDAQFMLLGGFIIAIGLVITTVILNSVIFEGNMAIGAGTQSSKTEIVNLMQITKDESRAAYRNVSAPGGNRVPMISNFNNTTRNFRDNLSTIYALNGEGVNVSWNVTNWNNGSYAYFTDNGTVGGSPNWTVIQNVNNSNITVNVSTGGFYINITNSTNFWRINFTNPNPQNLTINNSQINKNISQPFTVSFINGTNATGRFNITGYAFGRNFTRARDYILYANVSYSTSRVRADITIPISVPW